MPFSSPLTLSGVTYTYPGQVEPVLDRLSVFLPAGWTGVVGDNGCGKSTLGRLCCQELAPGAGTVSGPVDHPLCVFCAQEASRVPERLEDFACDFGSLARELRRSLALTDDMAWRYDELSVGERKKLQVAVALWQHPDVLVLDEPTNHVDSACRRALARACADFSGVGLLVSHDRELLDALAERCLCFEGAGAVLRPGGYTKATAQAALERAEGARARRDARREVTRLSTEHKQRARLALKTAARLSARGLDKHDSDGRGRRSLAVYTGKDGVAARLAARMDARVGDARERLAQAHVEKRYDGDLWFDARAYPRKVLARLDEEDIPCGPDGQILHVPSLALGNIDHVGIEGPNGAGKSTLLRHLVAHLDADVPALVMAQELGMDEKRGVLEQAMCLSDSELGRALSLVAQLNTDPKRLRATLEAGGEPSPGELRKLMLALKARSGVSVLVMDEPTNHLDLHSAEALERALAAFPGALVLVSHDATLLARTCTRLLHVEGGRVCEVL